MPTPSRFPNGITTAKKTENLGQYAQSDPTKWYTEFNDFINALDINAGIWTTTKVGTGTLVVSSNSYGTAVLTNTAADNDSIFNQQVALNCLPVAGKKTIFKARFKLSDVTQSDWIIGLHSSDTTPFSTGGGGDDVTDGMYFGKEDGSTNIDFYVQKDTTTGQKISLAVTTSPADNTYFTIGFEFDGVRYVKIFKNDVNVYTVDLTATPATYLPDTLLGFGFGLVNGEAVAKSMTVDYLFVAQER